LEQNKEDILTNFIIKNLSKDIDISKEGFVEFYAEIPFEKIKIFSEYFEKTSEEVIEIIKETIKNKISFIIIKLFKDSKFKNLLPKMKETELYIGKEEKVFFIQINTICKKRSLK
jgi:hypothetical protein